VPTSAIRFAISDGQSKRAAPWKIWTNSGQGKSDVYLLCRPLGQSMKVSFHESGSWHFAYTQVAFERKIRASLPGKADRYLDKWDRPEEIAPGITWACRIVTPWSGPTTEISKSDPEDTIWIPCASEFRATEIDVIFAQANTDDSLGWPGRNAMGTKLIGAIKLENAETVWIVHHEIKMPDFSKNSLGKVRFLNGKSRSDIQIGKSRVLALAVEQNGCRTFLDFPARLK